MADIKSCDVCGKAYKDNNFWRYVTALSPRDYAASYRQSVQVSVGFNRSLGERAPVDLCPEHVVSALEQMIADIKKRMVKEL